MVCDEGSQLVKLLGQIKNTEKEDHVQNDEIIESLMDEETNEESQELDFSLSNVDYQIHECRLLTTQKLKNCASF